MNEGVQGAGVAAVLWVDPAVHAEECPRFDSYMVKGLAKYPWPSTVSTYPTH